MKEGVFDVRGLLAIDGIIYRYMLKLYDLIVLNILFVVTSLPLITIGASITALYDVTLSMQSGHTKQIYSSYLDSFQKNIKQATQVWVGFLLLIATAVILISIGQGNVLLSLVLLGFITITMMALIYIFALISKFQHSTSSMIRNGVLLAIEHTAYSITMLSVAGLLVIGVPLYIHWAGVLSVLLTFSLTAYIQSYFLNKLFQEVLNRN